MKKIILGALIALTATTSLFAEEYFKIENKNDIKKIFIQQVVLDKGFKETSDRRIFLKACPKIIKINNGTDFSLDLTDSMGMTKKFDSATLCIRVKEYLQHVKYRYLEDKDEAFIEKFIIFNIRDSRGIKKTLVERGNINGNNSFETKVWLAFIYSSAFNDKKIDIDYDSLFGPITIADIFFKATDKEGGEKDIGINDPLYKTYLFHIMNSNFKEADLIIEKSGTEMDKIFWETVFILNRF